ncbi:MAG: tetratricopeptide repeat protein [Bryobacteraceae bacterium]
MRRRYLGCLLLACGLGALGWFVRPESLQAQAPNEYVDTAACATCHADIARTYAATGMARSFYSPDAASFPEAEPYHHLASDTWYQIVTREGAWYQRWWQLDGNGQEETAGESKIDYVMGSGNHVRTYLHRTARGTVTMLPLAWYAEKGGTWALNPGFDNNDPQVGRKVGYDCMFCHNSYPSIPSGHDYIRSEPVYTGQLPQGIDCQRCHGPGGNHLRAVAQRDAKIADIRNAIVNPARLGKDRGMEVCMQCHLETTSWPLPSVLRRFERSPFSYRPGEAISSFQLTFDHAPGAGRDDKFEIVNSVYRLRQSKCFLESKGDLGCTSCHDPHDVKHGQAGTDGYNQKCVGCHRPSEIAVKDHPTGTDCVSCHMPKRRTEDVVHAVMTDHLIQRRPPANALAEFPEKLAPEVEYRGPVVPYGDQDDLYTAIAQVFHRSNLEAGIPQLQAEIAKRKPERPEVYVELGDALQKAARFEDAANAYRVGLEKQPASALLWSRLAMPLRALGKSQEPLDALREAVRVDPNDPEAWYNLALLQSDLGDKRSAIDSFRKSINLDPESADSRSGLGTALAETGQLREAEAELRGALKDRPSLPGAHAYLAYLLASRGDAAGAIGHFERGGDGAFNQFNYGITLARLNRLVDARMHLERSLQANPAQPVAHEVVGRLLEVEAKVPEAITHYQEAIRLRPDFGQAHLDMGIVLARSGDRVAAAEEFRRAQLDPDPQVRQAAASGLAALGPQ